MHSVSIPDPLFERAEQAAAASGRSVDVYIREALQLVIDEDTPIRLSAEQIEIVKLSEADLDAGKGMSARQVEESLAAERAAWLDSHHDLVAAG